MVGAAVTVAEGEGVAGVVALLVFATSAISQAIGHVTAQVQQQVGADTEGGTAGARVGELGVAAAATCVTSVTSLGTGPAGAPMRSGQPFVICHC
jgi:hypothetical protein